MIKGIAKTLECERHSVIKKFGKKVFNITEMNAIAYNKTNKNLDVLTILDKDYNKLLVQKTTKDSNGQKLVVTDFYKEGGNYHFSVSSKEI